MAKMSTTERVARKAERVARDARMADVFARNAAAALTVNHAARDGRAFLDTFRGRVKVASYDHASGWAITDGGHFMTCVERFIIV